MKYLYALIIFIFSVSCSERKILERKWIGRKIPSNNIIIGHQKPTLIFDSLNYKVVYYQNKIPIGNKYSDIPANCDLQETHIYLFVDTSDIIKKISYKSNISKYEYFRLDTSITGIDEKSGIIQFGRKLIIDSLKNKPY